MKTRLVPMEVEHYMQAAPGPDSERAAEACLAFGPCFSAFVDDELAGVAGVMIGIPGVGEGWAAITDVGRRHPFTVHRLTMRTLKTVARDHGLYRVHVDVDATSERNRAWVERMGFHPESLMLWAGPGRTDLVRYRMLAL